MKRILAAAALAIAAASPAMAEIDLPACGATEDVVGALTDGSDARPVFMGFSTAENVIVSIFLNPANDKFAVVHDWGRTACIIDMGEAGMTFPLVTSRIAS